MNTLSLTALSASALLGALAAWLGAEMTGWFAGPLDDRPLDPSARMRREQCRRYRWFRLFESCVLQLAALNARCFPRWVETIERERSGSASDPFEATELMAIRQVQAVSVATVAALVAMIAGRFTPLSSLIVFLLVAGLGSWWGIRRLTKSASLYRRRIRARLPLSLELMALMIESGGADIMEALQTAADVNRNHPLGAQLRRVLRDVNGGMPLGDALNEWAERYKDDDVVEIAFAIRTSLQRGSPLQHSLRSLAEQFHQRRIQRLERAAEEAKVHITWPGLVVMVACLLIVAAPLVLAAKDILGL